MRLRQRKPVLLRNVISHCTNPHAHRCGSAREVDGTHHKRDGVLCAGRVALLSEAVIGREGILARLVGLDFNTSAKSGPIASRRSDVRGFDFRKQTPRERGTGNNDQTNWPIQ